MVAGRISIMARGGRRDLSHVCLLSFGWTREPVRAWFLGFASSSWRGDRALGSQIQKGPTVLPATRRGFCLRVAASGPGTKDRRDRAWPLTASGTRAPLGGDGRWEVARLSWTSGLLSHFTVFIVKLFRVLYLLTPLLHIFFLEPTVNPPYQETTLVSLYPVIPLLPCPSVNIQFFPHVSYEPRN